MRFSQRIGQVPVKAKLQVGDMDNDLRNSLWSAYHSGFIEGDTNSQAIQYSYNTSLYTGLWFEFFKRPLDELPAMLIKAQQYVRDWFFRADWHEVYSFIEFVAQNCHGAKHDAYVRFVNYVLEREVAGYRLVNNEITPITDPTEIKEIETAITQSQSSGLAGVTAHLGTALKLLSDRKAPDYRNSVKESISAVESIAKIVANNPKAELADALRAVEAKVPLHGALKAGFEKLYGYASDKGGIRHALLAATTVDFIDAQYMLVTCSAFVNFLKARAAEAGIPLK